jgi:ubiquinone/menaquinone biosynthesis C-methylase UbiE
MRTLQGLTEHLKQATGSYLRNVHPQIYFMGKRWRGPQGTSVAPDDSIQLKSGKVCNRLKGYRKEVRPFWYRVFDAVRLLDELCSMKMASSSARQELREIYQSDRLPRPLKEYELLVQNELRRRPELFYQGEPGKPGYHLRKPLKMIRKELLAPDEYLGRVVSILIEHGLDLRHCNMLDVGCGSGVLAYRLKMAGAEKVRGLDVCLNYPQTYFQDRQKALGLTEDACQFVVGNAEKMDFHDGAFDVIVSTSVIEHLNNVEKSFKEMNRVLRPGGLCIHFYCPYFGPIGGHSLLTLDFPWGHLRLLGEQLEEYLQGVRPNEVRRAKEFLEKEMSVAPQSLSEVAESAIRAGFQILHWEEGVRKSHIPWITAELLGEVKSSFPSITVRDLVVDTVWAVFRKE